MLESDSVYASLCSKINLKPVAQARPLVEPSQLRPRPSEPPPGASGGEEIDARPVISLPPDAERAENSLSGNSAEAVKRSSAASD